MRLLITVKATEIATGDVLEQKHIVEAPSEDAIQQAAPQLLIAAGQHGIVKFESGV